MIKDKNIYFGYGDIGVTVESKYTLVLREFKNHKPMGNSFHIEDLKYVKNVIKIDFSKDIGGLMSLVRELNEMLKRQESKTIEVQDYRFNFENFNINSVRVVLDYVLYIRDNLLLTLAC